MNREIKFRGKRVDNDEWVYGYLVFSEDYMFDYSYRIDIPYIIPINNFNLKDYRKYRVDETTIGQYTGLKDKNGKEIYEGDILLIGEQRRKVEVVFKDGGFGFMYDTSCLSFKNQSPEVIGNIYESDISS